MADELNHPGTITYIDGDTNQVVQVVQAADVSITGRFAETAHGKKQPVVKVIARSAGKMRFVKEYGPNDELLRSTTVMA